MGGNVFLTAIVGLLPLIAFFVLMGAFKVPTHWCSIISLTLSLVLAVVCFRMPVGMSLLSATQGLAMGFVPIIYIIIAAVWLYNLTEVSGRSQDLKAVFNAIGKGDVRAQALIVAFSFCGLLEGLAGFGAPVAITGAMLVTLGLPKMKAALVTIVGNAIYVGFGAMAIPVTTAANLGGAGPVEVAADMGRLTWILCLFIPALLLLTALPARADECGALADRIAAATGATEASVARVVRLGFEVRVELASHEAGQDEPPRLHCPAPSARSAARPKGRPSLCEEASRAEARRPQGPKQKLNTRKTQPQAFSNVHCSGC